MEQIQAKFDELVEPSKLKNHPKNPNKHGQDQIDRLAELYSAHGFRHPIIVSKQTGFIVAGHGRKLAAIRAGLKKVPVVYQDFENNDFEYAFMVADNAISEWSELDFAQINFDLQDLGPDFNVDWLGIKGFEIEMADKEGLTDPDELPDQVEPIAKIGDLFQLGEHRLLCGDSTDIATVEKLMNGEKADMVFTSPPYNFGKAGFEKKGKYENDSDDSDEHWLKLMMGFHELWKNFSEYQFINLQILAGNKIAIHEWLYNFRKRFVDQIAMPKSTLPAMEKNILNAEFELMYVFKSQEFPKKHIYLGKEFRGNVSNVYQMKRSKGEFSGVHRAGFDVSLPLYFMDTFLSSDKNVADPFGGTGTTLIACEKTNRKCFMMELDPHYVDVIIARWENFTGQKAVKLNV